MVSPFIRKIVFLIASNLLISMKLMLKRRRSGRTLFSFLLLSLFCFQAKSQTVFWSEHFTNGCISGCDVTTYTGPNGTWTQTITGPEGPGPASAPNPWYVSCQENGFTPGNCGFSCAPVTATATLETLHIGSDPTYSFGDIGAFYDAGGNCPFYCVITDRRAESPTINCTGMNNITMNFNYIMDGDPGNDYCTVYYFDGAVWNSLGSPAITTLCSSLFTGQWSSYTVLLPASANNNPNVKIGFRWRNNDDAIGNDPSIAIDEITLTVLLPPVAAFTPSLTSICPGSCIGFTDNSTNVPHTWSWSFPGGIPATSTVQNPANVCFATAGTYTVSLTASNAAGTNTTTQVITVNAKPNVNLGPDVSLCGPTSATLTAHGGGTYTWSPTTGLSCNNCASPVATPAATTQYTCTVTNALGCVASDTITVNVVASITAVVTPVTTILCAGDSIQLNATGGTGYAWTPTAGLSAANINNPWAKPAVTTTYTVTVSSGACAPATATTTVTLAPAATATITANPTTICSNTSVNLVGNPGMSAYSWSPGGQPTQTITVNTGGRYLLKTTNSSGCSDTTSVLITVIPAPVVVATVGATPICYGDSTTLTATGGTTYSWNPSVNLATPNAAVTSAKPLTSTNYTVTVTGANGCVSVGYVNLVVQTCTPPEADFMTATTAVCVGSCISFTDMSTNLPTQWTWNFPGGTPATSNTQNPTNICYNTAGVYNVQLIVKNVFGIDTTTMTNLLTISAPHSVEAGPNQTVNIGNPAVLNATSSGGTGSYSWWPPAGLSCIDCQTTIATPIDTMLYVVTYSENNGCKSSDSLWVDIDFIYQFFVPTGFSPNGDGHNDILYVRANALKDLDFIIYDRVGEKVFETNSVGIGWDGTYRGQPMNSGVYAYYLTATLWNGTVKTLHGDVTLIR
jgi:gliding motility-associated-like protein